MKKKFYSITYLCDPSTHFIATTYCSTLEKAIKVRNYLLKRYDIVCDPVALDIDLWDSLIDE